MQKILEQTTSSDPLNNGETRAIIDQILETNKELPGATMVVLNGIQDAIRCPEAGTSSKSCTWCRVILFLLYHHTTRQAYDQILHWNCLLCGWD